VRTVGGRRSSRSHVRSITDDILTKGLDEEIESQRVGVWGFRADIIKEV
jgi:hypothetical protein